MPVIAGVFIKGTVIVVVVLVLAVIGLVSLFRRH